MRLRRLSVYLMECSQSMGKSAVGDMRDYYVLLNVPKCYKV